MTKSESVQQIRQALKAASADMLPSFIETYRDDPRDGVQKLVAQAANRMKKYQQELMRLEKMRLYERRYDAYDLICGIDEAGRGPLAGPVCAAAVILPKDAQILYLNDSKKLSEKRREALYDEIMEKAIAVGVGLSSPQRIDEINILNADYEAMRDAVHALSVRPQVLLNDAVTIPGMDLPQEPIVKGDAKSVSIAAASVIAKVTRDRIMYDLDRRYPEYGFAAHKGYGTAAHIEALQKYGPCPEHRRTFIGHFVDVEACDAAQTVAGGDGNAPGALQSTSVSSENVIPAASPASAADGKAAASPAASAYAPETFCQAPDDAFSEDRGRQSAVSVGRQQEERAAAYLVSRGHRILERNFRCKSGEIDIISADGAVLVFTEVKYRADSRMGDPAEAVNREKKYRVCRAADFYRKIHQLPEEAPCRFDVIALRPGEVRHLENAFAYVPRY